MYEFNQLSAIMYCNLLLPLNRISFTAMTGQVLQLHGYLKNSIHIMVLVRLEQSSQFITLNLEPL